MREVNETSKDSQRLGVLVPLILPAEDGAPKELRCSGDVESLWFNLYERAGAGTVGDRLGWRLPRGGGG